LNSQLSINASINLRDAQTAGALFVLEPLQACQSGIFRNRGYHENGGQFPLRSATGAFARENAGWDGTIF
jgi:hypothetical protein